jgi:hypothetical protein
MLFIIYPVIMGLIGFLGKAFLYFGMGLLMLLVFWCIIAFVGWFGNWFSNWSENTSDEDKDRAYRYAYNRCPSCNQKLPKFSGNKCPFCTAEMP